MCRLVAVMSVIFASLVAGCAGGQPAAETSTTLGAPTSSASFSPASQREVQDHVIELFQRTVNALPAGTAADSSRFGGWGATVPCDDKATSKDAPVNYTDSRDLKLPPGSDYNAAVARVGDIWTSWGWKVIEREDFTKPNRFAEAPDAFKLQIELNNVNYPPIVTASSPCFSGRLVDWNVPMPAVIAHKNG